jgi:anti-sigma B factor antagonist
VGKGVFAHSGSGERRIRGVTMAFHAVRLERGAVLMPELTEEYVVCPEGELDLATVPALREEWVEVIDAVHPALFVIDLTRVTFLDSTALGAIIRVYKRQREHGGDVLVVNASPIVRKMFDITHLDWLLDLSDPERAYAPRPPTGPVWGVTHAARGFAPPARG